MIIFVAAIFISIDDDKIRIANEFSVQIILLIVLQNGFFFLYELTKILIKEKGRQLQDRKHFKYLRIWGAVNVAIY